MSAPQPPQQAPFSQQLIETVKQGEGLVHVPRPGPEGGKRPTYGYGHLAKPGEAVPSFVTQQEAEAILMQDLRTHAELARRIYDKRFGPGTFDSLSPELRDLSIDLTFQLGPNFLKFQRFQDAAVAGDLRGAAKESLTSFENRDTGVRKTDDRRHQLRLDAYINPVLGSPSPTQGQGTTP